MDVITRFAPSPTGILHIGNARTGLFNWLYARANGGKFLLRIEDTDKARSTHEAIQAIHDGLSWLGIDHDDEIVMQSQRADRHRQVALQLLAEGKAYHCYCSPQELEEMKEAARARNEPAIYDGRWRDRSADEAPSDVLPVVRFKAPRDGETIIDDQVQGKVRIPNNSLDDMVMLRADGSPTYMLSVVVDDHDMGVNTIIRGDDHLINAARQSQLILALGWPLPRYAHIPLIHGPDGKKLSKRHGAQGVMEYAKMGYVPDAMNNYLARLGWSFGDEEIFTKEEAAQHFSFAGINKAPARLDFDKLNHVNQQHLMRMPAEKFVALYEVHRQTEGMPSLDEEQRHRLMFSHQAIAERISKITEVTHQASYMFTQSVDVENDELQGLINRDAFPAIANLADHMSSIIPFDEPNIMAEAKKVMTDHDLKLGKVGPTLRVLLTGQKTSPSIFQVIACLGADITASRLKLGLARLSSLA